jgi:HlyD family secretion protein
MIGKSSRLWGFAGGAAIVALGAVSVVGLRRTRHVEVATAAVTEGAIVRRIVATGTLQAVTTVQVGAQVSGTIDTLEADYNSIVHRGQVLARLDPSLFEAALRESQAAYARAQAAEQQAEADRLVAATAANDARTKLTRAEGLSARELIPRSDLDAARIAMDEATAGLQTAGSQVQLAAAAVEEANAAVYQAKINLDHTVITSPIDGIVVARNVDVGQTVASAFQAPVLFTIAADLKQMQVETDIDEADIGGIQEGELAVFEVESYPDQMFEGTVTEVRLQPVVEQTTGAPAAGASTATPTTTATTATSTTAANGTVVSYATIVSVSNPDEKLRPGMTATVTLAGSRHDHAIRIPNKALTFRPPPDVLRALAQSSDFVPAASTGEAQRRYVWRFDGVRFAPIAVGVGLADGQWTEQVSGPLKPDDTLVTNAALVVGAKR